MVNLKSRSVNDGDQDVGVKEAACWPNLNDGLAVDLADQLLLGNLVLQILLVNDVNEVQHCNRAWCSLLCVSRDEKNEERDKCS